MVKPTNIMIFSALKMICSRLYNVSDILCKKKTIFGVVEQLLQTSCGSKVVCRDSYCVTGAADIRIVLWLVP